MTAGYSAETNQDNHSLSLDTLEVLLEQEERYLSSSSLEPAPSNFNQDWFRKMAQWCFTVAKFVNIDREVVEVSLYNTYRYISDIDSEEEVSSIEFQIISMSSLFITSKTASERALSAEHLESLGRKKIFAQDILDMELVMLNQLNWKLNPPTVEDFARCLLDLIHSFYCCKYNDRNLILDLVGRQAQAAVCDACFVDTRVSMIAVAALLNALEATSPTKLSRKLVGSLLFAIDAEADTSKRNQVFSMKATLSDVIQESSCCATDKTKYAVVEPCSRRYSTDTLYLVSPTAVAS